MTLSFTTQINKKPNYFIEKIWLGLQEIGMPFIVRVQQMEYQKLHYKKIGNYWEEKPGLKPKIHTIRLLRTTKDGDIAKKQWDAGDKIHPCINNRQPNYFQFAPSFPCVNIQPIEIKYSAEFDEFPKVFIDGKAIHEQPNAEQILNELAINDGFDDIDSFFNYFDKNFKGVLIHFTEHLY